MSKDKYVAMDVDSANIVVGVYDYKGESVMQGHIRAHSNDIRQFFKGLSGTIHVAFEEGTQAAWLYDLIRPLVAEVIVCDPRRNKLMQAGSKTDKIDQEKLGTLLRLGGLRAVYHGERSIQGLKHLTHGYDNLVGDTTRAKNRLKALFRGRGISCRGEGAYDEEKRQEWMKKLDIKGVETRASYLYKELDCLVRLKKQAEKEMRRDARRHPAYKLISQVPGLGPIRTAQIIPEVGTPNRFRTKRQFWPYCGLGVVTRSSGDYEWDGKRTRRRKKPVQTRGLNKNYNRRLKAIFKGAATTAICKNEEFKQYYERLIATGMREEMALLTIARKIAAITLAVWKKGESFDPKRLNQAAQAQATEVS
jgi:transposase